jgi:hypothetical protein
MLVVGVCVTPPATFFFGKATAASNSSVAAINLRSGRHDLIPAIALAPPAPPASAVNTDARHDDQPANALPRLNFDRHFLPPFNQSPVQEFFATASAVRPKK